jgi:hypothetical protein
MSLHCAFITGPAHKVQEWPASVSVQFGIKDLHDLVLNFALYFHQRPRFDSAIRDCTRRVQFKHGDMVDRVDFAHGIRKAEDEGVGTGLSNDFIWIKILFSELF